MKQLLERFNSYWQKMNKEGKFVAKEFVEFMEPAFEQAGFRKPRSRKEKPEILVVRDDAAGDFVLFSGFLRELRRIYPGAHITLVVSPRSYELAQCCPYVDNLELNNQAYDPAKFEDAFRYTLEFSTERLLAHHFDLAFCGRLGIQSGSILMMYMSGARQRVAYSQDRIGPDGKLVETGWNGLLTSPVPFPAGNHHDVDMDFAILEHVLQLPIAKRSLEIWYTGQDLTYADEQLAAFQAERKRIYAVVPGASMKRKQWPVKNYVKALRPIMEKEENIALVVLGGPGEGPLGAELQKGLGKERVLNLAGTTNFRQAGAVLSRCQLYIGSDTSLLHMASALGLPVLTIHCFAASLPKLPSSIPARFYPYDVPSVVLMPAEPRDGCKDALRYGCERENEMHCIRGVTPKTAYEGYLILQKRIKEKATEPLFLK